MDPTTALSSSVGAGSSPSGGSSSDLLGGIVGLGSGLLGSAMQMWFNSKQASEQRDYETSMADTTYQRGESDLVKAGLNPVLLAQGASDPTPVVSAASISNPDLAGSIQSGVQSQQMVQNISQSRQSYPTVFKQLVQTLTNLRAQGDLTSGQSALLQNQANQLDSVTDLNGQQKAQALAATNNLLAQLPGIKAVSSSQQADVAEHKALETYFQSVGNVSDSNGLKNWAFQMSQFFSGFFHAGLNLNP